MKNIKTLPASLFTLVSFFSCTFVYAADAASGVAETQPMATVSEKGFSFKGDSIILEENIPGFVSVDDTSKKNITAPKGARFFVTNEPTGKDGKIYLDGYFDTCKLVYWLTSSCNGDVIATDCTEPGNRDQKICGGWQYRIGKDNLITRDYRQYGFSYGIMIVPFKVFFSDRSIGTGSTIGPYLGYGISRPGIATAWAISAGLASIPVTTQQANGTATTQNETGLSYAIGYLATIKDSFHLGVFVGRDSLSKASPYQYNNKSWLGLQFAYSLNE